MKQTELAELKQTAIDLLMRLIAVPSFSREEDKTAGILVDFLQERGMNPQRVGNNVWAKNKFFRDSLPTILLNSHHDTVKPNPGYTRDPFKPAIEDGKLYGLGSNDAGGPLVSLLATFVHYYHRADAKYNFVFAASAEEEISGLDGIEALWPHLPRIDYAIVGEPTLTDIAVAEKGLLVLDCTSRGKAGHAARDEGVNSIYLAMHDISWFQDFEFPKKSEALGRVKMSVTVIHAGQAHNQVPPECKFTVDVRVTDAYTLEEVVSVIRQNVSCEVVPRSLRLRPSGIPKDHPMARAGVKIKKTLYGSPTTSDQALIPCDSIKMGPGDSARSHSADEYIFVDEIGEGIDSYIRLIDEMMGDRPESNK